MKRVKDDRPEEVVVRSREGPLFDDRVAKAIERCARGGKVRPRPTIEFVVGPALWDGDRVSFADAGRLYPQDSVAKTEEGPFWNVVERGDGWVRTTSLVPRHGREKAADARGVPVRQAKGRRRLGELDVHFRAEGIAR